MSNIYAKYLTEGFLVESETKTLKQTFEGMQSELTLNLKKEKLGKYGEPLTYFNIKKWVIKNDKGLDDNFKNNFSSLFSFLYNSEPKSINNEFDKNFKHSFLVNGLKGKIPIFLNKISNIIYENFYDEEIKKGVNILPILKKYYPKIIIIAG